MFSFTHEHPMVTRLALLAAISIACGSALSSMALVPDAHAATTRYVAQGGLFPNQLCPFWNLHDASPFDEEMHDGFIRLGTGSDAQNLFYSLEPPKLQLPADSLIIQFRARRYDGASSLASRAPMAVQFQTTAFQGNALYIGDGEIFVLSGITTKGAFAVVPTADAMHDYRIVLSGVSFVVYRDGVPTLSGTTFSHANLWPGPIVLWGEASSLAHGNSDWEYFEINASSSACAVPAASLPSVLAMATALSLLGMRFVKRPGSPARPQ